MAVELKILGQKIVKYRNLLDVSVQELSQNTGIKLERIMNIENGDIEPSGDEVLIISDYFRCDYSYFISNQKKTVFEQTDKLFRKFSGDLSKADKWVIQDVLYFAECEHYLNEILGVSSSRFNYTPQGNFFKEHGIKAAESLRKHFKYKSNELSLNVYRDFRKIGIKIYRKKLENSKISGIYINHPIAGDCVIVNYTEDVFRQRFTAAHEAGHAIFDSDNEINVSFSKWNPLDLVEIRANNFSSYYLCPPDFLNNIPDNQNWDKDKLIHWSKEILANPKALLIALKNNNLINKHVYDKLDKTWIDKSEKIDPELLSYSNEKSLDRISHILENGISMIYLNKCFKAYENNLITFNRMKEMLFLRTNELLELFDIFNKRAIINE